MDEIAERIIKLEESSRYQREQFERYCQEHKEDHQSMSEDIKKNAIEVTEIGKTLQTILYEVTSKSKDKETRRIMYGTIIAALFAGMSPIITAMIKG